jgi:hypothetical protein
MLQFTPAILLLISGWFPIQSEGRLMQRDWFPYAVADAAAIAIAVGLWLFGVWFGG